MTSTKTILQHAFISLITLTILLASLWLTAPLAQNFLAHPERYQDWGLTTPDIEYLLINVLLITSCVLISYIVYLLLSAKTRAEIVASGMTKSLFITLEQLKNIFEGAPVPYITLDQKGNILDPNKAALRFFNANLIELQGKNLFSLMPEKESEESEQLLRYYKSQVPINRKEIKLITKDDQTRWILLSIFKMEGPGREGRHGLAALVDITEEKELDRAKSEFVSLASHQLRTPTATMKWFLEMLLSKDLGDLTQKQQEYLERANKVNTEMVSIVETLLNVSRIESGTLYKEEKSVNVPALIEDILIELSPEIESKELNVSKQYEHELEDIVSDPKLLRIVIHNLISNAIRYTPPGGTVTISLEDSFGTKTIVVSDTGIGIPEIAQDKIFTKLFRAENARKFTGSQGTGLGLYMVKSIVESLGGSISFTSEEDKGSTFSVKFKKITRQHEDFN